MAVTNFNDFHLLPSYNSLITLPKGSKFFYLPGRIPIGYNPHTGRFEKLTSYKGEKVFALSVFLPPSYLRLYNPSYFTEEPINLPLWAYTPCGYYGGKFYATAKRVDPRIRQLPHFYNDVEVKKGVRVFLKRFPNNRLYRHLAHCALYYNCLAAKNLFLKRWEAPLPTSPTCNARCIGCLSLQENGLASHQRIKFVPSIEEMYQLMFVHFQEAKEPIVSFGQGCEGEPLINAKIIAKAVKRVRKNTLKGTININTNGSIPEAVKLLCEAGVDSFRVTLNSARKEFYYRYFKPSGYDFEDVIKSIRIAKRYKKFVSVNLLIFPGFTDSYEEMKAFFKFIRDTNIDMVQLRNLNIDPDYFLREMKIENKGTAGMDVFVKELRSRFPYLKIGYFNLSKKMFFTFKNFLIK